MALPTEPLVRLVAEGWHGTGLLISDVDILTARHVVEGREIIARGQAWPGERRVLATTFHPDAACDLALAHIGSAGSGPPTNARARVPRATCAVQIGDSVVSQGFSTATLDPEERRFELAAYDGVADVLVLDRPAPEGFSGAPAFAEGRLAGVLCARDLGQQCTFVHRLAEITGLIKDYARGEVSWDDAKPHWLRRFPLGPCVTPADVFMLCYPLILAYARMYEPGTAHLMLAQANGDRVACGPNTGQRGLVDPATLPNPHFDPLAFWQGAFGEAGLKSPRMLAAVAGLARDERLTPEQQTARNQLFSILETWGQPGSLR